MKIKRQPGKIPGVEIELGDNTYIMPPLNVAGLQEHDEAIQKVQRDDSISLRDKMELIANIALTALRRNYPTLDIEFMREWVDMRNMLPIFRAIMGISGFEEDNDPKVPASELTGPT